MSDTLDPLECVGFEWIKEKMGMSRRTVYRRIAANNWPKPCNPPGTRPMFRKKAILTALKQNDEAS